METKQAHLSQSIKYNINQRIQWPIAILLLGQSIAQTLRYPRESHVVQIVADDGIDYFAGCVGDGLHDVSEGVDEEVEDCATLGDGT